jgi:hypothetical protein
MKKTHHPKKIKITKISNLLMSLLMERERRKSLTIAENLLQLIEMKQKRPQEGRKDGYILQTLEEERNGKRGKENNNNNNNENNNNNNNNNNKSSSEDPKWVNKIQTRVRV